MSIQEEYRAFWEEEEKLATIRGWDFSHLKGRWSDEEDQLPWSYKKTILKYLEPHMKLLDIDTGGGEFLLSLNHPYENTFVTEAFEPNFKLCNEKLSPLGITVKNSTTDSLPFDDNTFDIILNRHGDLNASEFFRVLKPGGIFITQQVGAYNDREFIKLISPQSTITFPNQYLQAQSEKFEEVGFEILEENEGYHPIKFYDVGALVWFAKIIEWEFKNFSVDKCIRNLFEAQKIVDENEFLEGKAHRFFFVAKK